MIPHQRRHGKGKRVRSFETTAIPAGRPLSLVDMHDLAYWCQWRLAIHTVCARFDVEEQSESNGWAREKLDQVNLSRQAALCEEVRHLQSQLGKHTSINGKLEAVLAENAQALAKMELARVASDAAASRLQTQLSYDKEMATASARELERRISHSSILREGLEARAREADAAKLAAEQNAAQLERDSLKVEAELGEARKGMRDLVGESQAERVRMETMAADLESSREKYSVLKRRYGDAGRKVEAVRAEREVLRQERAALEDKLADVEKFQSSERGRALDRMEQDLAKEKMARVELEADRDDLQSQLAAALQVTART